MNSTILVALRRRWAMVAASVLVATSAMAVVTMLMTPEYISTSSIFVSANSTASKDPFQGQQFSAGRIKSYADIVGTQELAASVIEATGVDQKARDLARHVSAQISPETIILTLAYRDTDPKRAQLLAQAYAEALTAQIDKLETPQGTATSAVQAQIVDPATLPRDPSSPNAPLNLLLGGLLGLLLGVCVALLRERLDTTIVDDDDVLAVIDAPVLARIPASPAVGTGVLSTFATSNPAAAEAYRSLRTTCLLGGEREGSSVIALVSASSGVGTSTTAVNLALAIKETGLKVLLIDGNLRRPMVHTRLGLTTNLGLADVLAGDAALDEAVQTDPESGLHVLTAGTTSAPSGAVSPAMMAGLMGRVRERYDQVLIDTAALLMVGDALTFCAEADQTLLVGRWGSVTADDLGDAADHLGLIGVSISGVVLTRVPTRGRERRAVGRYVAGPRPRPTAIRAGQPDAGPVDPASGSTQDVEAGSVEAVDPASSSTQDVDETPAQTQTQPLVDVTIAPPSPPGREPR